MKKKKPDERIERLKQAEIGYLELIEESISMGKRARIIPDGLNVHVQALAQLIKARGRLEGKGA